MPVVTLGGTFLASSNPPRLLDWFRDRFDLEIERHGDGGSVALPSADGVAILGIQQAKPEVAGPEEGEVIEEPYGRQPMMLNLRVKKLDAIVKSFNDAGEPIAGPQDYEGM